jgi:hypothetical protein
MRIYEGAPRQDYEEALRSIGTMLDQRGLRELTLTETEDGFVIQGLAVVSAEESAWNDPGARLEKQTFFILEDDISRFIDEAARRRGAGADPGASGSMGFYEQALRVIGAYVDQQQPRDIFFFEQDRQFVMRLLMQTRGGLRHVLVEFTADEIQAMIAAAPNMRGR